MKSEQKNLFDPDQPLDHGTLMLALTALESRYSFLRTGILGNSILGRPIPLVTLGTGTRKCLYVATHHAMEVITSAILLRFLWDFCNSVTHRSQIGGISPRAILDTHMLFFVPMLNPDGVAYRLQGLQQDNPLYDRVLKMNGDSTDFSHWQANARGVDLNHNYDAGFYEYKKLEEELEIQEGAPTKYSGPSPESEPETAALCNLIRCSQPLLGVLTLHTQGEEIFYRSGDRLLPQSERIARHLSVLSGYRLSAASGTAAYGGLTDWCVQELGLPSFTVECGLGKNPLPNTRLSSIYCRLRQMLFAFPTLL